MKNKLTDFVLIYACLLALVSTPIVAAETDEKTPFDRMNIIQNELNMVDDLIAATKKSLANEVVIRELLTQYKVVQKQFIGAPDNKEYLFGTVKTARNLLDAIQKSHLTQNFDPEFLSELTLLSQIGSKRGSSKN